MPDTRAASGAFDHLAGDFFSVWLRYHPDAALAAGIADFADQLPPRSDDDQAALASYLESLILALEELDADALDEPRRIDLALLSALAFSEHRELLSSDWRHRDPLRHLSLGVIHRLTMLNPDRLRDALAAMLGGMPGHLRLAQTQLAQSAELVPAPLAEAAVAAASDGRRYLRELARSRWLRKHCHGYGEVETLAEAAATALGYFGETLAREVLPRAAGRVGCGLPQLRLLLRQRHFLDVEPAACGGLLEALAAGTEAAAFGDGGVGGVPEAARAGQTLELVRTESAALAARLEAEGIATLPPVPLQVRSGPACPRPGRPCIDYVPDLRRGEGVLCVSEAGDGIAVTAQRTAIRLECLHLGWGGAHLLGFAGGMAARSLPRRLAASATLAGGWGLALDRRLFDADGADLGDRKAVLSRRARAIRLARVDLDLHAGRLSASAALDDLIALGLDRSVALGALAGIIQRPGDALARVLGWRMIELARKDSSGIDERAFNDRLLTLGPVPLPLALRHAVGDETERRAAAALVTEYAG